MKPFNILAVVQPGLEELAQRELIALGYRDWERIRGGIFLKGHQSTVMRLNFCCRTLSRILIEIAHFEARNFAQLEKQFALVPWRDYIDAQKLTFRVTSYQSELYHEKAIEERLINSLAQILGKTVTVVGSPDEENSQLISIYAKRDRFTVRMDSTGAHLHKRGYGIHKEDAPLRETLACAMLITSGFNEKIQQLCDPMCGSGTIPIEAALMAKNVPLSEFRTFAFQNWSCFQSEIETKIRTELMSKIIESPKVKIIASDSDEKAIASALANAKQAGVDNLIEFRTMELSKNNIDKNFDVVTNPPWGKRLAAEPVKKIHRELHSMAERGQNVYLILPGTQQQDFGYTYSTRLRFEAGGIKVKFIKLEA
ncbi:MAG: methyltransferase [Candidatus Cloacimonadaceae bacterium]